VTGYSNPDRRVRRAFERVQATNSEAVKLRGAGRDAAALNTAERAVRECVELCAMDPNYRPVLVTVLVNAANLSRLNEDVLSWLQYAAQAAATGYEIQDATGQAPPEMEAATTVFEQATFLIAFGQGSEPMQESFATVLDGTSPERRSAALETIHRCLWIGDRHRRAGSAEVAIGHYNAATVLSEACHALGPDFLAADCAAWMSLAEARVLTTEYRQGARESASRAAGRALNWLGDWFRTEDVGYIFTPVGDLPAGADAMRRCALVSEMLIRYAEVLESLGHSTESRSMETAGRLLGPEGLSDRSERVEMDISRDMAVERFNVVEQSFADR
jgi:hypothetical protein